jgi:hypothetical protein
MISYTNCKVSDVQSVIVHSGDEGRGYGFSILRGPHGRPRRVCVRDGSRRRAGAGGGRKGG